MEVELGEPLRASSSHSADPLVDSEAAAEESGALSDESADERDEEDAEAAGDDDASKPAQASLPWTPAENDETDRSDSANSTGDASFMELTGLRPINPGVTSSADFASDDIESSFEYAQGLRDDDPEVKQERLSAIVVAGQERRKQLEEDLKRTKEMEKKAKKMVKTLAKKKQASKKQSGPAEASSRRVSAVPKLHGQVDKFMDSVGPQGTIEDAALLTLQEAENQMAENVENEAEAREWLREVLEAEAAFRLEIAQARKKVKNEKKALYAKVVEEKTAALEKLKRRHNALERMIKDLASERAALHERIDTIRKTIHEEKTTLTRNVQKQRDEGLRHLREEMERIKQRRQKANAEERAVLQQRLEEISEQIRTENVTLTQRIVQEREEGRRELVSKRNEKLDRVRSSARRDREAVADKLRAAQRERDVQLNEAREAVSTVRRRAQEQRELLLAQKRREAERTRAEIHDMRLAKIQYEYEEAMRRRNLVANVQLELRDVCACTIVVRDASTGETLEGVEVLGSVGEKDIAGGVTNESGAVTMLLPQTRVDPIRNTPIISRVVLSFFSPGYEVLENLFEVPEAKENTTGILLSRVLLPGEMRFVLTWNEKPRDLDLALVTPGKHVVDFESREADNAVLEVDAQDGYGPESLMLHRVLDGEYELFVTNATPDDGPLSASGAHVTLVTADGKVAEWSVKESQGDEPVWRVCRFSRANISPEIARNEADVLDVTFHAMKDYDITDVFSRVFPEDYEFNFKGETRAIPLENIDGSLMVTIVENRVQIARIGDGTFIAEGSPDIVIRLTNVQKPAYAGSNSAAVFIAGAHEEESVRVSELGVLTHLSPKDTILTAAASEAAAQRPPYVFVKVRSAITREPIVNAKVGVSLRGRVGVQSLTFEQGLCVFQLPFDHDEYLIEAEADGFLLGAVRVSSHPLPTGTRSTRRLAALIELEPAPRAGEAIFTLTWHAEPRDLELVCITPDGTEVDSVANEHEGAMHDGDVSDGFGPETITITNATNGQYYIFARANFSDEEMLRVRGALRRSFASLRVALCDGTDVSLSVRDVPAENEERAGRFWHICRVNPVAPRLDYVQVVSNKHPAEVLSSAKSSTLDLRSLVREEADAGPRTPRRSKVVRDERRAKRGAPSVAGSAAAPGARSSVPGRSSKLQKSAAIIAAFRAPTPRDDKAAHRLSAPPGSARGVPRISSKRSTRSLDEDVRRSARSVRRPASAVPLRSRQKSPPRASSSLSVGRRSTRSGSPTRTSLGSSDNESATSRTSSSREPSRSSADRDQAALSRYSVSSAVSEPSERSEPSDPSEQDSTDARHHAAGESSSTAGSDSHSLVQVLSASDLHGVGSPIGDQRLVSRISSSGSLQGSDGGDANDSDVHRASADQADSGPLPPIDEAPTDASADVADGKGGEENEGEGASGDPEDHSEVSAGDEDHGQENADPEQSASDAEDEQSDGAAHASDDSADNTDGGDPGASEEHRVEESADNTDGGEPGASEEHRVEERTDTQGDTGSETEENAGDTNSAEEERELPDETENDADASADTDRQDEGAEPADGDDEPAARSDDSSEENDPVIEGSADEDDAVSEDVSA